MTNTSDSEGRRGDSRRAREVVVYTRTGCMFCKQVEDMLIEAGITYRSERIEDREEQDRLCAKYGALAFPLVLAGSQYVGGFTHVVKLHSEGRLRIIAFEDADPGDFPPTPAAGSAKPKVGGLAGYAALGEYMKNRKK